MGESLREEGGSTHALLYPIHVANDSRAGFEATEVMRV